MKNIIKIKYNDPVIYEVNLCKFPNSLGPFLHMGNVRLYSVVSRRDKSLGMQ